MSTPEVVTTHSPEEQARRRAVYEEMVANNLREAEEMRAENPWPWGKPKETS